MTSLQSLYDAGPSGLWVFLLCTVILGGGTAFVTGKAIAETWRPVWQLALYAGLLALATRFLQFSLFEARLTSLPSYLADALLLLAIAGLGYALTRRRGMATQYGWPR